MKKNIIFGMLVSLLAIPTLNAQTQTLYSNGSTYAGHHYTKGNYITVGLGFAGSGMATTQDRVFNEIGGPSINANIRYTYFMLDYMGITTGLDFTSYKATLGLQGRYAWDATTDMGMAYERFAQFGDGHSTWTELENLYMLEIPIALTFKYKPNKIGFIGTAGLKMGFPVAANYKSAGNVDIYNYYPSLNLTETSGAHISKGIAYEDDVRSYDKSMWQSINGQVFAEFGALFQVHPRLDLSVSVYGNYGLNNSVKASDDFGFANAQNKLNSELAPMPEYKGLMGTAVDHVNLWSVGGKVALHINVNKLSDEQLIAASYIAPDVIFVHDTVARVVKKVVHDTIHIEVPVESHAWVLQQKVTIAFKFNDSENPIIEPANMLETLAAALVEDPKARVAIVGYASREGGSETYNMDLSTKRAQKVADMLRARGVKDEQMEISAAGDTNAKDHKLSIDDRVRSRRVEVTLIP